MTCHPTLQTAPKVNVRTPRATMIDGPLRRVLTDCRIATNRYKDGHDWLIWSWQPEPRNEGPDYGFTAIRDDHEEYEAARALFFEP